MPGLVRIKRTIIPCSIALPATPFAVQPWHTTRTSTCSRLVSGETPESSAVNLTFTTLNHPGFIYEELRLSVFIVITSLRTFPLLQLVVLVSLRIQLVYRTGTQVTFNDRDEFVWIRSRFSLLPRHKCINYFNKREKGSAGCLAASTTVSNLQTRQVPDTCDQQKSSSFNHMQKILRTVFYLVIHCYILPVVIKLN